MARKQHLQAESDNISFQLLKINQKMNDLSSYASILSQDAVSLEDIGAIPTSLFGQGLYDLQNFHNQALATANNEFAMANSSGVFGQNPNQYIQQIAHQKMYENARKQIQKSLTIRLNEQEKSLKNEKTRLEARDTMINKELESMDQKISQGIQSSISGYGLRA